MAKFKEGDKVIFKPPHADNLDHKDCEIGEIRRAGSPVQPHYSRGYYVDYFNDGSPNAKLTYERHLYHTE